MMKLLKRIPYWYLLVLPYVSLYFGAALNQLVMLVNGNTMPVYFPKSIYSDVCSDPSFLVQQGDVVHTCMTHMTHLKFQCDWISLGNPVPMLIMSPGDIFIFLYEMAVPLCFYLWIVLIINKHLTR
jgi:hypothetical protein